MRPAPPTRRNNHHAPLVVVLQRQPSPVAARQPGGALDGKVQGRHHPSGHQGLAALGDRRPGRSQGACKTNNLNCKHPERAGHRDDDEDIAESMENDGVKVLMIVNLDNASGAAMQLEAKSKGITTVDYDRLTLGGSAALYVSYDGSRSARPRARRSRSARRSREELGDLRRRQRRADRQQRGRVQEGLRQVLSKQAGWKKAADQSIKMTTRRPARRSPRCCSAPGINAVMSPTTVWPTRSSVS